MPKLRKMAQVDVRKQQYETKRKNKLVSFNTETEKDLLSYADSLDFSVWVKTKLADEMAGK